MAVTLLDVAREAGVAASTVSRVLNNRPNAAVPPATAERIRRTAKELNFVPNASARALVSRRTHTIGLFIPDEKELTDPHFGQMLVAVEAKARELGYFVVLATQLNGLVEQTRVDGIVALTYPPREAAELQLNEAQTIYVYNTDQTMPNCVTWSDHDGGYRAGQYLMELGHRRVAALYGSSKSDAESSVQTHKAQGFAQAIREAGAQCRAFTKRLSVDEVENGYLMMRALLQERNGITAVFTRHDLTAMGVLKAVREAGISVPGDLSIISYFDTLLASSADPSLTSIRTPIAEAGEVATEQLVRRIEGKNESFPGVMLPTSLTVRASCAPPRT